MKAKFNEFVRDTALYYNEHVDSLRDVPHKIEFLLDMVRLQQISLLRLREELVKKPQDDAPLIWMPGWRG